MAKPVMIKLTGLPPNLIMAQKTVALLAQINNIIKTRHLVQMTVNQVTSYRVILPQTIHMGQSGLSEAEREGGEGMI